MTQTRTPITIEIVRTRSTWTGGRPEKSHARFSDEDVSLCQTKTYHRAQGESSVDVLDDAEPDCRTCQRLLRPARDRAVEIAELVPPPAGTWLRIEAALSPRLSRTFLCSPDASFRMLGDAINVAYDRDDDHLWQFELRGRRLIVRDCDGDAADYESVLEDADYQVSRDRDVTLAETLRIGERFRYLFDLGDRWQHELHVLAAECPPSAVRAATGIFLLDRVGASPRQYA